eukprot:GDKJ01064299.1.p1 GENE.GDKJ01064299.1~~GDKJ01064299.1.p1  ORF type:complete len:299 (+),score=49.38 GDKJ01064299.1:28-897(+)
MNQSMPNMPGNNNSKALGPKSATVSTVASRHTSASKLNMKAPKPEKRKSLSLDEYLEKEGIEYNFSNKPFVEDNFSHPLPSKVLTAEDGVDFDIVPKGDLAPKGDALGHRLRFRPKTPAKEKSTVLNGVYDRLHAERRARSMWIPGSTNDGELSLETRSKSKMGLQKLGMEAARKAQEEKYLARIAWAVEQNPSGPPPRMARSQGIIDTGGILQCSKQIGIDCKEGCKALDPHKTKVSCMVHNPDTGRGTVLYGDLGVVHLKQDHRKMMDGSVRYIAKPCDEEIEQCCD